MKKTQSTEIALVIQDLSYLKEAVDNIEFKLDNTYVTKENNVNMFKIIDGRLSRLEKILYTAIGIVAISVLSAILSTVVVFPKQ